MNTNKTPEEGLQDAIRAKNSLDQRILDRLEQDNEWPTLPDDIIDDTIVMPWRSDDSI